MIQVVLLDAPEQQHRATLTIGNTSQQQCSFDQASSNYKAGVSASALIEAA